MLRDGRSLELPGRGRTWIRDVAGPSPGAPTVVLLHGLGATGLLNWFPSFEALRRTHRVIAVDHRGHGRGITPRGRFRLEDCADDAASVVAELALGPVVLAGYSMGGPIAQLVWKRHPDVVRGVVFCATSHRFGAQAARFTPVGDAIGLGLRLARVAGRRSQLDPAAIVEATMAIRRFDSTSWIGALDVPAASVVTLYDRLVPPRRQRRLAELARAEVFDVRGGHDVCVRHPERFVPSLVEAVRAVS